MSIGSESACLASAITRSALPPTPMPRMPGGHQPAPRLSTVSTTQSATLPLGFSVVNLALFSDPPPLAATSTSTVSPATISTVSMQGVLSPEFLRAPNGSTTTLARSGLVSR